MTRVSPTPTSEKIDEFIQLTTRQYFPWLSPLIVPGGAIAIIDLPLLAPLLASEEMLQPLLTQVLSLAEARLFAGFTFPKRRLEWLGGRLVAKHCLCFLQHSLHVPPLPYSRYSILPDANGRPCVEELFDSDMHPPAVSISHSKEYAVAIAQTTGACGIDIQKKSEKLSTLQNRFASPEEISLLGCIPDIVTRLTIIWAVKEAVKKCVLHDAASFLSTIQLVEFVRNAGAHSMSVKCILANDRDSVIPVSVAELDNYVIAGTAGGGNA